MSNTHDLIIVGAGPRGHAAAEQAARQGAKVAIVRRISGAAHVHTGAAFRQKRCWLAVSNT